MQEHNCVTFNSRKNREIKLSKTAFFFLITGIEPQGNAEQVRGKADRKSAAVTAAWWSDYAGA